MRTAHPFSCSPRVLWFVAASSMAGMLVLYVLAVGSAAGQLIDTRLMWAVGAALGDADWTATLLEVISPASVLAVLCLLVAAALALRGPNAASTAAATVVTTLVASEVLKHVLVRPTLVDDAANSLPSGHVSAVAAVGVAAYLALPGSTRSLAVMLGLAVVTATTVATMALGWHRPSDALASVLLAVGVGAAVTAVGVPDRAGRALARIDGG